MTDFVTIPGRRDHILGDVTESTEQPRPAWPTFTAIGIVVLFVAGVASGFGLASANGTVGTYGPGLMLGFTAFTLVGSLIVARQHTNPLGWLFAGVGILISTGMFTTEYATYGLVTQPGSVAGATWAAWYSNWFWYGTHFCGLALPPLLFPTGRLLSPRWRPFFVMSLFGLVGILIPAMFAETLELQGFKNIPIDNPIGIAGVVSESGPLNDVGTIMFAAAVIGGVASMIVRLRRSSGIERAQLKWFTFSVALLFFVPLGDFFPDVWEPVQDLLFPIVLAFVPVSAGIAILRYHLYDIDVVINRTLVYVSLTAILAGSYLLIVVSLQQILSGVTQDSDVAIAGSTLMVAALFRPMRTRLQSFIDRRFYRQKYDAAETLGHFSARLRDEVDLDSLHRELVTVVTETMQPTHASLWLRKAAQ